MLRASQALRAPILGPSWSDSQGEKHTVVGNDMRHTRGERRVPSVRARELREELFPIPADGLTTVDAAHVLDVDASTVRRYIRDGKLPAVRVGRDYVITEDDLRAFVLERQAREKAERQEAA